jgi:hypothetical protein
MEVGLSWHMHSVSLYIVTSYAGQHDSALPHSPQGADGTVIQTSPHEALASCGGQTEGRDPPRSHGKPKSTSLNRVYSVGRETTVIKPLIVVQCLVERCRFADFTVLQFEAFDIKGK